MVQLQFSPARLGIATFLILVFDLVWLKAATTLKVYPSSAFTDVKIGYGLLAWIPLALAQSMGNPKTYLEAIVYGGGVGFLSYSVFNGTELALRPDWRSWKTPSLDILWGTVQHALVALLTFIIQNAMQDKNKKN
jgi:uncharacterized membrane protein